LQLNALWEKEAIPALRPELAEWGRRAVELKLANPSHGLARYISRLTDEFPRTMWWMTAMYPVYFKAAAILYEFRSWQRHFYLAYLSKYFRVGLFGGKWSHVGKESEQNENGKWVDFLRIPQVVARGKVALDIVAGWDEEGLTAKTFELAACGVAMIHNECVGLQQAFVAGKEIEIFQSPRQAREQVQRLLDDPDRRKNMAHAGRERLLRQHTWAHRVQQMMKLARIPIDCFR
jgi:spore maturation protein CgeB